MPNKIRKRYDISKINSAIDADPIDQTTVIKVSAKADLPKDSVAIVNAVTNATKTQIPKKVPSPGKVSLSAKAVPSEVQSKTSPSIKKYTLRGASIGFLLGLIIAFSGTVWTKLI